eukprot:1273511-Karenia_brevis.AAC.1
MDEVAPTDMVWACFGGLSMGWSWALYFCHEALSSACRQSLVSVGKVESDADASEGLVGHRG